METRRRSIVKAVIWNLIGLTVMAAVGFAATGSWAVGGWVAAVNSAIGMVSYVSVRTGLGWYPVGAACLIRAGAARRSNGRRWR